MIQRLADLYPSANRVYLLGLNMATDRMVWEYARTHDYIIVTKDVDFSELLLLYNFPPKIIWIRRGNCSTQTIEDLLRTHFEAIETMSDDPHTGIITLF